MKYLDSNIIAYAFYQNEFQDSCQKALIEGGVTSTINLIEAFNIIEHETDRKNALDSIRGILRSNIEIVEVDVNILFEALKRSILYKNLKLLDLIFYIVAGIKNCDSFVSYDKDFDGLEIIQIEPS
jgi:predicted nucleic acid-binding protein